MNALFGLLQRQPLIFFHLLTASGALLLGALMLLRRKDVAGLFTLLPGRFLGSLLWGTPMTGIAS